MKLHQNKEWLIQKYHKEQLAMWEIAEICNLHPSTVWHWMRKLKVDRRQPDNISLKTRERMRLSHTGKNNPRWRNGTTNNKGRIMILRKNHPYSNTQGYISRSRLIVEKVIGRYLKISEIVHHINFDVSDDRKKNLLVAIQSYHMWLHRKIQRLGLVDYFKGLTEAGCEVKK